MYPSLASLRWHRQSGRPYMVSPRGMLNSWALSRALLKKKVAASWFEREHLRSASCLHALNEAEAKAIRAYGLSNPICIVPNGVDLPEGRAVSAPPWADGVGGRRVLLFLGRLHPKKNLISLIRAWKDVQSIAAARDWLLVIAGWDQDGYRQQLERMAETQGGGASLRFAGPQFDDDKAASFAHADAFVLPSLSEGLPVAVLEAWSYGLPVLMTEACNLPEGFAASAALPIETDRVGVANGLRQLFAMSDAERRDMGARGQALVRERFTWSSVGEQMTAVYQWVLGGGSPPSCVLLH